MIREQRGKESGEEGMNGTEREKREGDGGGDINRATAIRNKAVHTFHIDNWTASQHRCRKKLYSKMETIEMQHNLCKKRS